MPSMQLLVRSRPAIDQPPCRAISIIGAHGQARSCASTRSPQLRPNNLGRGYLAVPRSLPVIKRIRALVIRGLVLMNYPLKLTVERIGDRHSVLRQGNDIALSRR